MIFLFSVLLAVVRDLNQGSVAVGLLGGLMALWVTFVRFFVFIFAGAAQVVWIATGPRLRPALAAGTAVVVGMILNLLVWFAVYVLFGQVRRVEPGYLQIILPVWSTLQPLALALSLLAGWLLLVRHVSMPLTPGFMAALAGVLHPATLG